ncbi:MAG: hypothetical protein AB7E95_02645 [Kiritimatiellales bacterium]
MQNVFTDYPDIPWKPDWQIASGPGDNCPFITKESYGTLSVPGADWMLEITEPSAACSVRLFADGLSFSRTRKKTQHRTDILNLSPGVLYGICHKQRLPRLIGATGQNENASWAVSGAGIALLAQSRQTPHFVLVHGAFSMEQAYQKAEQVLTENHDRRFQEETERRQQIATLFTLNSRHNPPAALAAESLVRRLREKTGPLPGLWSLAEGFEQPAFSLNELYPLVQAWNRINPTVSFQLMETALALQGHSGGLPAWIEASGQVSFTAPWPMIIQAFDAAWSVNSDIEILPEYLPKLRKYILWALRHFDPHHDGMPCWQSQYEVFIPGSFKRHKSTADLVALLIAELDALLRLCQASPYEEPSIQVLTAERDRLKRLLLTIFWNPDTKTFSTAWDSGHFVYEPTFGALMPMILQGLDSTQMMTNEENGEIAQKDVILSAEQDHISQKTPQFAIQQFMVTDAVHRVPVETGLIIKPFVRDIRETISLWFNLAGKEQPSSGKPAYELDPITASLILLIQNDLKKTLTEQSAALRKLSYWKARLRLNRTDFLIVGACLIGVTVVHLAYNIPREHAADTHMANAALNYKQGRLTETLAICRRYPNHPLSQFLSANLFMLTEQPQEAEQLYRKVLLQKTESPSALLGLALSQQINGKFDEAVKRYIDFLDLYEERFPEAASIAEEFLQLTENGFSRPPRWRAVFSLPLMQDLGL